MDNNGIRKIEALSQHHSKVSKGWELLNNLIESSNLNDEDIQCIFYAVNLIDPRKEMARLA